MNTNTQARRVLCYGDSNTWGYIPASGKRYPIDIRWTGLLQSKLGSGYEIIEEGLNSRTTNLDDPKHPGKNGLIYLRPCLETHEPLDLVVLMLGTNDLKERFNRQPKDIAEGLTQLIHEIQRFSVEEKTRLPKILIVSPPYVDESVAGVDEKFRGAEAKSKELAKLYAHIAKHDDCAFIDIAETVTPSKKDGYHLDPEHQHLICNRLAEVISSLLSE